MQALPHVAVCSIMALGIAGGIPNLFALGEAFSAVVPAQALVRPSRITHGLCCPQGLPVDHGSCAARAHTACAMLLHSSLQMLAAGTLCY